MLNPSSEFIQEHLDQVSRSFAFCIRQLPEPLRLWVGVSYLLCRIVDTIEDSEFSSETAQKEAFDWFDRNISERSSDPDFPQSLMPTGVTGGETSLLRDAALIFEIFWSLDEKVRVRVSELALSMSQGMRHFRFRAHGPLKLKDLKEVNQYCFFVAGLVGEMLVGFISQVEPRFSATLRRVVQAHHFGLFLQKVNLLKDQVKDQKLGRFLVPSRGELEGSAEENAKRALDFLVDLPLKQIEFRRFCAWSLFMGLESLKVASLGFSEGESAKLSRSQTEDILLNVEESLQDNGKLSALFHKSAGELGWDLSLKSEVSIVVDDKHAPHWIHGLYKGSLPHKDLEALGIS